MNMQSSAVGVLEVSLGERPGYDGVRRLWLKRPLKMVERLGQQIGVLTNILVTFAPRFVIYFSAFGMTAMEPSCRSWSSVRMNKMFGLFFSFVANESPRQSVHRKQPAKRSRDMPMEFWRRPLLCQMSGLAR